MLDFPRWKVWLVSLTLVLGVYYAIPSFLPERIANQMPGWLAPMISSLVSASRKVFTGASARAMQT